MTKETLERVKSELWRTAEADPSGLVAEQREILKQVLDEVEGAISSSVAAADSKVAAGRERRLNELLAPHLPVLLGRSFPLAVRDVLPSIRTEEQRAALLAVSQFVMGVQQEIGDALTELQWRQQEKVRELCEAALEGGAERCQELAEAMRDELDTDFCNYLNYAIEQEETRLREEEKRTPFVPPPTVYGGGVTAVESEREAAALKAAIDEEREEQAQFMADAGGPTLAAGDTDGDSARSRTWQQVLEGEGETEDEDEVGGNSEDGDSAMGGPGWVSSVKEDPNLMQASQPVTASTGGDLTAAAGGSALDMRGAGSDAGDVAEAEAQQWLLVLRLVRQGVYTLLAKDYRDDVKHLRVIIGLASAEARLELTRSTLLQMNEEEQDHFARTAQRIADNLSVQRNARDAEIHQKVTEVRAYIDDYFRDHGVGEFAQM